MNRIVYFYMFYVSLILGNVFIWTAVVQSYLIGGV